MIGQRMDSLERKVDGIENKMDLLLRLNGHESEGGSRRS
jgi:hypothetical protein